MGRLTEVAKKVGEVAAVAQHKVGKTAARAKRMGSDARFGVKSGYQVKATYDPKKSSRSLRAGAAVGRAAAKVVDNRKKIAVGAAAGAAVGGGAYAAKKKKK